MVHFLTYPTCETFACGLEAIGRRSMRVNCDTEQTTCGACLSSTGYAISTSFIQDDPELCLEREEFGSCIHSEHTK